MPAAEHMSDATLFGKGYFMVAWDVTRDNWSHDNTGQVSIPSYDNTGQMYDKYL